jgi:hypothetical protein
MAGTTTVGTTTAGMMVGAGGDPNFRITGRLAYVGDTWRTRSRQAPGSSLRGRIGIAVFIQVRWAQASGLGFVRSLTFAALFQHFLSRGYPAPEKLQNRLFD